MTALENSLAKRFQQLKSFYDSGAIGMDENGLVALPGGARVRGRRLGDPASLGDTANRLGSALRARSQSRETSGDWARRMLSNSPAIALTLEQ